MCVLFFVTLSYLDVIGYYTKAGGSYVVARDNFGPKVAQIAAVALLIDYTVTVAVQTSAGTAALTSAVPESGQHLRHGRHHRGVVLILLYGNLRGIREAGSYFAVPTYFFIIALATVIIFGLCKEVAGTLHQIPLPPGQRGLRRQDRAHRARACIYGLAFVTLLPLVRQRRAPR